MTREERDELIASIVFVEEVKDFDGDICDILRSIVSALPVADPAPVGERSTGRACPCGAYAADDVELIGVQPDGTVSLKYGGICHVCPPQAPPSPVGETVPHSDGLDITVSGFGEVKIDTHGKPIRKLVAVATQDREMVVRFPLNVTVDSLHLGVRVSLGSEPNPDLPIITTIGGAPSPVGETVPPDGTEWSRKPNVADITEASKYRMINGKMEYWSDLFNGWKTATVYTTPQAIRASNNFNENAPAPTELEAAATALCEEIEPILDAKIGDVNRLRAATARVRAAMGRKV